VTIPVVAGNCYKIRVGGFGGDQGDGTITITKQPDANPECPGVGDCCIANGTVGCNNVFCCNLVCTVDPFCCFIEWDEQCAAAALERCPVCGP